MTRPLPGAGPTRGVVAAAALVLTWLACGAQERVASPSEPNHAQHSDLWGQAGELWTPTSRLPDVAYAGYERGEQAIPSPAVVANVRDFGARGDGVADDTQAFQAAIRATAQGAILVPAGRYTITDLVTIDKPNLVLRGEGRDRTV
ncbi:MAG TPA: glycosyl hydrolase family 28-related protein, partial [Vicinamibacteria bacterium]|nr:glycosyl hydrolase family 28-related protein [Vicinamibacteria bacterium]